MIRRVRSFPPGGRGRRIGRELWPAGRVARVVAGLLFAVAAAATVAGSRPAGGFLARAVVVAVLSFVVIAAAYTLLVWVAGDRLLARAGPWLAALVLIAPLAVLGVLPVVSLPVRVGADVYVAVCLLVQAAIGYGGCEVAGVPALLLRRRYTVYCALNGVDVAERRLRDWSAWVQWPVVAVVFVLTMGLAAATLTLGAGAGFWAAYLLFLLTGWLAGRARRRWPRRVPRASGSVAPDRR